MKGRERFRRHGACPRPILELAPRRLGGFLGLVMLGASACVTPQPPPLAARVRVEIPWTGTGGIQPKGLRPLGSVPSEVASIRVTVTDPAAPASAPLATATATPADPTFLLSVPAEAGGSTRRFAVDASDAGGAVVWKGSTTATLYAGQENTVVVDLWPNVPFAVVAVTPGANAADVLPTEAVAITFSKSPATQAVSDATVFITDPTGTAHVPAVLSFAPNEDDTVVVLTPSIPYLLGTTYTVTVLTSLGSADGQALGAPFRSSFGTVIPPSAAVATVSVTAGRSVAATGTARAGGTYGVGSVEVSVDGGAWTAASGTAAWSYGFTASGDGVVSIRARAWDTAGNAGAASPGVTTMVDTTPPALSIAQPPPGSLVSNASLPLLIAGSASDGGAGVQAVQLSGDGGASWSPATGTVSWSYAWSPTGSDGLYVLEVRAQDASGNLSAASSVTVTVDRTAPTAAVLSPSSGSIVTTSTATVGGTASDNLSGVQAVQVSTDGGATWSGASGTAAWTYAWIVTGADGVYTLGARALDFAGNLGAPAYVTAVVRRVPPPPASVSVAATATVSLSWSASPGATGYAVESSSVSGGPYTPAGSTAATTFLDVSVPPGTIRYYVIAAANASGLGSPSTQVAALTIPAAPTGLGAVSATSSIALTWGAPAGATGYVVFHSQSSGGPYGILASVPTPNLTDNGATSAVRLYYVVEAANASGLSGYSNEASGMADATPPVSSIASPANGAVTSAASISVTGTASDVGTGVSLVQVSSDGGAGWATATGAVAWTYAWSPTADAVYSLASRAQDSAGNVETSPVFITVAVDRTPPVSSVTNPVSLSFTNNPYPLGGTDADNLSGIAILQYSLYDTTTGQYWNGGWITGSPAYVVTIPVDPWVLSPPPTFTDGHTYTLQSRAQDAAGNVETPSPGNTFTIDYTAPTSLILSPTNASTLTTSATTISGSATDAVSGVQQVQVSTDGGVTWNPSSGTMSWNYGWSITGNDGVYTLGSRAVDAAGNMEAPSYMTVTVDRRPAMPTGVTAASQAGLVLVSWNPASGATAYLVERSGVSGGPYTVVGNPSATSYSDGAVTGGATYYYVVAATNAYGMSASSAEASALTAPDTPAALSASGFSSTISLVWTASVGATTYVLSRSTSPGGPYAPILSTPATNYLDTSVFVGTTYYYVVQAQNASGTSGNSTEVASMLLPGMPPTPFAQGGVGQITVVWGATPGATSYLVNRSLTCCGSYATIASTVATGYVDTTVAPGTTYYYEIAGVNLPGQGPNSSPSSALTAPAPPTGVSSFAATASVQVYWNASTGATGYPIFRSTVSGGPYAPIFTSTGSPYTDSAVTAGLTFYYVLSATNASGMSPYSLEANATLAPAPPTSVAIFGNTGISVTSAFSTGATAYRFGYSTVSGGSYTFSLWAGLPSFAVGPLAPATVYYAVVQAENAGGMSGYSTEVSALTVPAAPLGLTATAGTGQVGLTWSASPGATSYLVSRATVSGGPYGPLAPTGATAYLDSAVTGSVTYYYVLQSANVSGLSPYSSEVSATPSSGREICVANEGSNTVAAFDALQNGDGPPLRMFGDVTGMSNPTGLYVDTVNNEFGLANYANNSITVYGRTATGNVAPLRTISGTATGLSSPYGIYVDTVNDEIGVVNYGNSSITVYGRTASGNVPPLRTLSGASTGLASPWGVYLDTANGEIGVANYTSSSITVYSRTASGNVPPLRMIQGASTGMLSPAGLYVDTVNNEIGAANFGNSSITVYGRTASGNVPPLRTLSGASTGLSSPWGVYVDTANNEIGVASKGSGAIAVFSRTATGNVAPLRSITGASTGLSAPYGIFVDTVNNEIGVGNDTANSITVYGRTASGNVPPLRTLSGGSTGLSTPDGIYVDTVNGEIGVANNLIGTITVYGRTASGTAVVPLRAISGASTGLGQPIGVYVDTVNNEIGVANYALSSITIYGRTASGNVPPLRTLSGASTGLSSPYALYVDTVNNEIGVVNAGSSSITVYGRTASGNAAPLRIIAGAATGLSVPVAIYADTVNNEIGVGNYASSIAVYSRTASGNTPPLRMIQGASTGLTGYFEIYGDTVHDEIGVANDNVNSITVFSRTATGDVAPLRTISGPTTGLSKPWGIAVCK